MSLLDSASLIVTPNGYKEGKLYSVIPSDGSGDMSVVRATTATRVNSSGLVELVPYNLVNYSEQFDNAAWTIGSNTTLTSGFNDPFGGSNAWRLTMTSGGGTFCQQTFTFDAIPYTFSVWAKANGNTHLSLQINGSSEVSYVLTNEWQRITLTYTSTAGAALVAIGNSVSNEVDALIYGAQLVEGSVAKDYQKTETRLNIPRLDYSNGTCPSLLVEPQRTNLLTYSSSFDNADWTKGNGTITANATTSPSGITDADLLTENTANTSHVIYRSVTGTSNTFSFYAKPNGRNWLGVLSNNGDVTFFDIANGTLGTIAATSTATIEDAGNGWYRCTVYNTHPTFGASIYLSTGNGITDYLGNGTSGAYIWGAQLEAGSYPTSYIPTTSASVTRNADVISKTGISSLIGQTEGTIFFDGVINGCQNAGANFINSEKNLNTSFAIGYTKSNKNINASVFASGVAKGNITNGVFEIGERVKIAYAYKSGDFALYVNGSLMGTSTDTFTFPSTLDDIFIGDPATYFAFQEAITNNATALYKTRLTNAELATLTTI